MSYKVKIDKYKFIQLVNKSFGSQAGFWRYIKVPERTYYRRMREGWPVLEFWGICHVLNCEDEDLT